VIAPVTGLITAAPVKGPEMIWIDDGSKGLSTSKSLARMSTTTAPPSVLPTSLPATGASLMFSSVIVTVATLENR
jgi:hypothetical protein